MYAGYTYLSEIQFKQFFTAKLVCSHENNCFYKYNKKSNYVTQLDYFHLITINDQLTVLKFDFADISWKQTNNKPVEL